MAAFSVEINPKLFKILFPKGIAYNDLSKDAVMGAMKRRTDFGGRLEEVTIDEAGTASGSPDFNVANANKGTSQQVSFTLRRRRLYEIISVQNEALMASKGEKNAVKELAKHAGEHAGYSFALNTTTMLWSREGGSLGKIASGGISGSTVTLDGAGDAVRFQVGNKIEFANDNGTGAAPAGVLGGGPLTVTAVNYEANTVTFNADVSASIASVTAGTTLLFKQGFYSNSLNGIPAWIPISAPGGSDSFLGVNRSEGMVTTRSGIRFTASGGSYLDKIIDASSYAAMYGADAIDRFCVNYRDFAGLQKELRAHGNLNLNGKVEKASASAMSLVVPTSTGFAEVSGHRFVPQGYSWGLTMSTWELASAGEWGHIPTDGRWKDSETSDAKELRMAGYGEVICREPGKNMVFQW